MRDYVGSKRQSVAQVENITRCHKCFKVQPWRSGVKIGSVLSFECPEGVQR